MKKVMHFESTKDRLNFIRGKHTEIVPIEVEVKGFDKAKKTLEEMEKKDAIQAD